MTIAISAAAVAGVPVALATPLGFGVAATIATLVGGLLGLRLASRIVLVLGLTAGIVLGVALFDLVPEALALGGATTDARVLLVWVAVGLGGYMAFERVLGGARGGGTWRAHLAPATLTLHSFMDGLGIGIAFQVSPQIGGVVALAVLTHDIADGVNTVSLCLAAERHRAARGWLLVNGMAPLLGVVVGLLVRVPPPLMAPLMATFAGVFLYIGACELVPRSHALDPRLRTTVASLLGMALMFAVTAFAQ
ncbi:ZIP family metal transporter [Sphingomonas bacterium]|uniref:ZIP family metal transporter n=1 Tax=Sphingomonas bacterium TaxID=1895847 RepID=UPI001574F57C|nr:ZIP family metal transporter [Sphingomonas bacterium]